MGKTNPDKLFSSLPDSDTPLAPTSPDRPGPSKADIRTKKGSESEVPLAAGGQTDSRKIPSRKLYQDEVYGTKELSPLAVAVIDTPEFQRLAYIYQLGFTHTVFRGATHRRFDHSVGTYFVVRTLLRRIVQNHTRLYDGDPEQFCHPGLWLSPRLFLEAPATP